MLQKVSKVSLNPKPNLKSYSIAIVAHKKNTRVLPYSSVFIVIFRFFRELA